MSQAFVDFSTTDIHLAETLFQERRLSLARAARCAGLPPCSCFCGAPDAKSIRHLVAQARRFSGPPKVNPSKFPPIRRSRRAMPKPHREYSNPRRSSAAPCDHPWPQGRAFLRRLRPSNLQVAAPPELLRQLAASNARPASGTPDGYGFYEVSHR